MNTSTAERKMMCVCVCTCLSRYRRHRTDQRGPGRRRPLQDPRHAAEPLGQAPGCGPVCGSALPRQTAGGSQGEGPRTTTHTHTCAPDETRCSGCLPETDRRDDAPCHLLFSCMSLFSCEQYANTSCKQAAVTKRPLCTFFKIIL